MTSLDQFIEHLITCANNAADAMEGADWEDFIRAEERMCTCTAFLKELGVKYDPCTGKRDPVPRPPAHCADCAPEFDCWTNPNRCRKPGATQDHFEASL